MTLNKMTALWARTGLIWFLLTMAFGMYLGLTGQFGASSSHAHLGLLGWLSAIAFAFLHSVADPEGRLARAGPAHWALHNLGLVVHATCLWLVIKTGNPMFGMFMRLSQVLMCAAAALALAGCNRERAPDSTSQLDPRSREILAKANIQVDTESLSRNCIAPGDATRPIGAFSDSERRDLIACANREVVRQMSPRLPLRIDDVTSMTSVVASGPLLTYTVRVDVDASQLTQANIQQLDRTTRANVCGQAPMRQTISYGGAYAYVWVDRAGRQVHQLRIDSC